MKTVYTITAEQFAALQQIERTLRSDTNMLSANQRRTLGRTLGKIIDTSASTCTEQMEPSDRKGWAGIDRRVVDRRNHDTGPIIRNAAVSLSTGEQA